MALRANFQVERMYRILKNGIEILLTEDEVKAWLDTPEVKDLITQKLNYAGYSTQTRTTIEDIEGSDEGNEIDTEMSKGVAWTKRVKLPEGFEEITRAGADPKNAYKATTFVYAKNHTTGEYGFRVINKRGKKSPFNKIGKISDPHSLIGSFLRAIPIGKTMIKRELFALNVSNVTEGRRLKALVEILEHQGYLEKKQLLERNGRYGYTRTDKTEGLEVGIRNGLNEPLLASNP